MKIRELQIHNYRSIADATIALGDYSLLIGPNNSGKSNVLDALRTFYEQGLKFDYDRDFPKFQTADRDSWAEIEFELDVHETANLKVEYRIGTNRCRVRKWFWPPEKTKGLYGYEGGTLSENLFYGWKNVAKGKLGSVIYIPAVSRLDEHTKLTGPSALRDLIEEVLKPVINGSRAYEELRDQVQEFSQKIKAECTADGRSLADLEKRVNQELDQWGVEFHVAVRPPQIEDIIKTLLWHTLTDRALETEMSPDAFGHGLQRHLIFTLVRLAAEHIPLDARPEKKDFSGELLLLLFEEPEAYLHPPQQSVLDTNLRRLAAQSGRQVIAATHSPQFVSFNTDDLTDLVRLRRVNGKTESAQISRPRLNEIFQENQQLARLLGLEASAPELEAVRHFLWLNPERSAAFFAESVLIVEGLSEQVLINYLLKTGQLTSGSRGVFILEVNGKYNIHRFMNCFGELKIDHAVLHDVDEERKGKEKEKQDALNKLIDHSRNRYTKAVDTLPGNLEQFLGITTSGDRWRKASEVLLAVQSNKVDQQKLDEFRKKVAGLLEALADRRSGD